VWEAFLRYWASVGDSNSHRAMAWRAFYAGDSNSHRAMAWRAFYAGYTMAITHGRQQ